MLSRLRNMFRVADLRNKILFTIFIICDLPGRVAHPGSVRRLRGDQAAAAHAESTGGVVGFLDLFSGGALTNVAIFFLGIMPYITASIIMQLLGVVIPKLEEWQNEGQAGQKKITQWTRYLTVGARPHAVDRLRVRAAERQRRPARLRPASSGHGPHPELHAVSRRCSSCSPGPPAPRWSCGSASSSPSAASATACRS